MLTRVVMTQFRNITAAELKPHPGLSFIYGSNAAGKSSVLEALELLSLGKSFRSQRSEHYIQNGQQQCAVFAELLYENHDYRIGLSKHLAGHQRAKINNALIKRQSQLTDILSVTLIHPDSFKLLLDSPGYRRKFIDWLCYYYSDEYKTALRTHNKLLKQRNTLLRQRTPLAQLKPWTEQLAAVQVEVHQIKQQALNALRECFDQLQTELYSNTQYRITSSNGFKLDDESIDVEQLTQHFDKNYDKEIKYKRTLFGPHLSDFKIFQDDANVVDILSRSEVKVLLFLLYIARIKAVKKDVLLLIDDFVAEFDLDKQAQLLRYIGQLNIQTIITSPIALAEDSPILTYIDQLFHVDNGELVAINPATGD